MVAIDYADLGKRIRKKRESRGLTQTDLAEQVELSIQHISNVENGKTKVSLEKLVLIANVLDSSLDGLLCGSVKEAGAYNTEIAEMIELLPVEVRKSVTNTVETLSYVYRAGQEHAKKEL